MICNRALVVCSKVCSSPRLARAAPSKAWVQAQDGEGTVFASTRPLIQDLSVTPLHCLSNRPQSSVQLITSAPSPALAAVQCLARNPNEKKIQFTSKWHVLTADPPEMSGSRMSDISSAWNAPVMGSHRPWSQEAMLLDLQVRSPGNVPFAACGNAMR